MKIDIYKPVVLFLLPAVLAGCSSEREPFPQGGKAGLRIESCSSRGGTDGSPTLVKDFGMVLLDSKHSINSPFHSKNVILLL